MKKKINLIILLFLIISCSSDSNENENSSTFSINLTPSATNVVIDQAFTITVSANEDIKQMWVSTDNFATGGYAQRQFGSSYTLNFNFDVLGQKTISIRAKNQDNVVSEKQVVITVSRGNAIKINGVQVVSFYGIDTTYDPEFGPTDPNRLADLRFGFIKYINGNYFDGNYAWRLWYSSIIIENQGSMTWDISQSNLYINPNHLLRFGLVDMDGDVAGADLLNGPPDYREISFSNYLITKPTTLTYTFPEINLEFKVFVEWAN